VAALFGVWRPLVDGIHAGGGFRRGDGQAVAWGRWPGGGILERRPGGRASGEAALRWLRESRGQAKGIRESRSRKRKRMESVGFGRKKRKIGPDSVGTISRTPNTESQI
jgi:hypothetical protein